MKEELEKRIKEIRESLKERYIPYELREKREEKLQRLKQLYRDMFSDWV